ncbi:MAG: glycosyltransferase [Deltaproteobacteria bacterium]|nr:glycosyltransferase [Deltaproteobacteria bacterium]
MIDSVQPDYTNTPISPQRPPFLYAPSDPTAPPAVTIVTPFYNTGAIFQETVQSVLQQSLQQWEWLIVNDGSTDAESLALLNKYRARDPRIRVLDHAGNQGLSAARNTGFRAARAPYVVQLDGDDLLEPTAVEKWVWFLESYPEFAFVKGFTVGFGAQEYLWTRGFHDGGAFLEENLIAPTSAIRTSVHTAVRGYDEENRDGLEDWDFWLRCAHVGYWGGTVPEYLDWYRRRPRHVDRWTNWDNGDRQRAFHASLRQRYAHLWNGGFPQIQPRWHMPSDTVPATLPYDNRLRKEASRLLMIVPWLTLGGADKFNLDLLGQLTRRGWEVSIATTLEGDHSWLPAFARLTPDIFVLHRFLRLVDYPRFLRYLIQSRQIDVVLISHSELGYLLLPYLRAHCPQVTFVDLCHIEEEHWKNGGHPRLACEYQSLLDGNVVVSEHLKRWMGDRGADLQRIRSCYINVDPEQWRPDVERRAHVRRELDLPSQMPVVFYAGRLCEQKQPRVFAQVMLRLSRSGLPFRALVAGDGPDAEWLRSFLKNHGLNATVHMLGAVSSERMRELMTAVDLFFLPSQWEGIALSFYEAMACELPVVGADVGGQRELVTPDCGVLIPRSSEEAEADIYARTLLDLLKDPERLRQMGKAARRRIEAGFRLEQMGERMDGLLREFQRLHETHPRVPPSRELGQVCAAQAVEYQRLWKVADGLWRQHGQEERLLFPPHLLDPHSDSWRTLAYFSLRRLVLPYYQAALNRNMRWLLPLKNTVKRMLLPDRPA